MFLVAARPREARVPNDSTAALRRIPRPAGYTFVLSGAYEAQQETFGELRTGSLLALALVYMVLAAQYESLRDPLVVMMSGCS